MYEELRGDLAAWATHFHFNDETSLLLCKAADAIEDLDNRLNLHRQGKIGHWIPVTERLPDILHTVIISGRMKYEWEKDYTQFVDVATYTEGEFFETFNDWYEGQHEFEITHWMPLPEPPKDGE